MKRSTNLVIISGPSGSGQDSVIAGLAARGVPIEYIMTIVTRPMRPSESEGRPYHFVTAEKFDELVARDELAEWAVVYGNKYGVAKQELKRVKSLKDRIGIWKMEWHGVKTAKSLYPDILAIMIVPPSLDALVERSKKRAEQNQQEIQARLTFSREMLEHKNLYDYEVVNTDGRLEQTIDQVIEILKKEGFLDNADQTS